MSKKQMNFVKQAAVLAAAGLLVRFIGFVYRLPLTSMIGDEGNGIYGAGYNLYTFFLIMSSAGLPVAISKMVSQRLAYGQYQNAHRIFRVSLVVAAASGLAGSLALGFGARWLAAAVNSPRSYLAILTLSPTVFIVAVMAVFRGYFQGMGNTVPTALSQIIEQIFNAVFSVFLCYMLMKGAADVMLGAAGGTAGTGVGALAGLLAIAFVYFLLRPVIKRNMRKDIQNPAFLENRLSLASELVKTAVPIIIGTAIFSVTNLIDMKMVNSLLLQSGYPQSEADQLYGMLTGKYVTLTTLPVSISTALAAAAVPNIAQSFAIGDRRNANRKINMALRLTMIISVPAAVGIGVLGGPILQLLFPKYPGGTYLLSLGAISIIFLALSQIVTGMLQGAGRVQVPAIAAFCGALVKIPLNFVLIPIRSVNLLGFEIPINVGGAVISTIACYVVASAINLAVLKRVMGKGSRMNISGGFVKPLFASAVMGCCAYSFYKLLFMLVPINTFACLAAILLSMAVYLGFMLLIRGITPADLQLLNRKRV